MQRTCVIGHRQLTGLVSLLNTEGHLLVELDHVLLFFQQRVQEGCICNLKDQPVGVESRDANSDSASNRDRNHGRAGR